MTNVTSLRQFSLLGPNETHAPIAILTHAERAALLACLRGGCLQKRKRAWSAPCDENDQPIARSTIVDLRREGLLVVTAKGKDKTAQLTPRGNWFARTIASRELELQKKPRHGIAE